MSHPGSEEIRGVAGEGLSVLQNHRGIRPAKSGEHLNKLRLAVALNTGNAQNLALADLQGQIFQDGNALNREIQILNLKGHLAHALAAAGKGQVHLPAHHHQRQVIDTAPGRLQAGINHFAGAQNRDTVRDGGSLLQLVGDDNDAFSRRLQIPQNSKQLLHLLRGQNRRRLVQNQDIGAAIQGFQNLNPLLLTHRQILHLRVGVDTKVISVNHLLHLTDSGPVVHKRAVNRLPTDDHILRNCHNGGQHKMLVYHADTQFDGLGWVPDLGGLAVDQDLSFVAWEHSVQDIHKRRFAGTVFPQQGMDFSLPDGKVHMVKGAEASEPFGDTAHLNCFQK